MKSGIYIIKNITNNKVYIGQSNNINLRLNAHKRMLKNNIHYNIKLQNSYNKYTLNYFTFEILEFCNINELNIKEINYIKEYNSVYNGYNMEFGGTIEKIISDELRQKLSDSHKGKISPRKGIKTNKPSWNSGKKGLQKSSRRIKIQVINKITKEDFGIFNSQQEFCKSINYKSKNFKKLDEKTTELGNYYLIKI
jgi:group I intron endonuclease